jgi:hypothetical protein
MTARRRVALLAATLALTGVVLARAARAQDSEFGIRGLGSPGHWESASSRATAGAFAAFDELSALADASLAFQTRLTATAMAATSRRSVDAGAGNASITATRFPLFQVSGPVYRRFVVGGGYTAYLDQTYRVLNRDTLVIRGDSQVVTDELRGDGGVSDLRLAMGTAIGNNLFVGAGIHGLVGSTRIQAGRTFADTSAYKSYFQQGEIRWEGLGGSVSAIASLFNRLMIAVYGRSDAKLTGTVDPDIQDTRDLPYTLGGAVRLELTPSLRLAGGITYRNWSVSADSNAYNTLDWSVGAELGSPKMPLRFGVRGGQLPFGPGGQAPTVIGGAGGTGFSFAKGHGRLDLGLEYLQRTSGPLRETVWTTFAGITVRP